MKSYLPIALIPIALAGCTKHTSAPPSCSTAPNTITISDNGSTYCIGGNGVKINFQTAVPIGNNVAAMCYASDTESVIGFAGDGNTFSIDAFNDFGPGRGIGTYSFGSADSGMVQFTEKFAGGQSYKISGGAITVSSADSARVQATFVFNLYNNSGTKTITGTVKTTSP